MLGTIFDILIRGGSAFQIKVARDKKNIFILNSQ